MWTVLGAPLDSSGTGRGEERAPAALRAAGLPAVFGVPDDSDLGDVTAPLRDARRDPETGILALDDLRAASLALRTAVADVLGRGSRPLLLGGDCSVLVGALAGARASTERIGLWFVDGHADYHDGRSSPTGEAADMGLAIVSGAGPPGLVDLAGPAPLVSPSDVVLLGHRPVSTDDETAAELARVPSATRRMTAVRVATAGPARVGAEWERALAARGPVWLHVDLDVLDETVLPAVTYPQPLGLDWTGFAALIRPLLASSALVGVSVADFNPDLDPAGTLARQVVAAFAEAYAGG